MNTIKKRSVKISGHTTSVSLEQDFWVELSAIADKNGQSINALVTDVDATRDPDVNLSSALRLYVLRCLKDQTLATQQSTK